MAKKKASETKRARAVALLIKAAQTLLDGYDDGQRWDSADWEDLAYALAQIKEAR